MIDWIQVAAQAVNFLLLLWLLHRFLYRPVVETMRRRQQRIEAELEEARRLKEEAEALRRRYEAVLATVSEEKRRLLEEAKGEVEAVRERLLEEAKREVEAKRRAWIEALEEERRRSAQLIERALAERFLELLERAFADLSGQRVEEAVVATFLERLTRDPEARRRLQHGNLSVQITTAHPLPPELKAAVERGLRQLNPDITPIWRVGPSLLCGIELEGGGYLWRWHLKGYLEALRDSLVSALEGGIGDFRGFSPGG